MENIEGQQGTNQQLTPTSVAGGVFGLAANIGIQINLFNNAYRAGSSFGGWKGYRGGASSEALHALASGEKVFGNVKAPFTGWISQGKYFGIFKGKTLGEAINSGIHGSTEAKAGFGFYKGIGGHDGTGIGYNFGFNKQLLADIDNGIIDKNILKSEIEKVGGYKNGKFKTKNITKEQYQGILEKSITEKFKNGVAKDVMASGHSLSRQEGFETSKDIANFIKKEHNLSWEDRDVIRNKVKEHFFEKEGKNVSFKYTDESILKFNQELAKMGIIKGEKEVMYKAELKIAEKVSGSLTKKIESKLATTISSKVAKYAALTPLLAAGPIGAGVATIGATAFGVYDAVSLVAAAGEANNMYYDYKKNKQKERVQSDYNVTVSQNNVSMGAMQSNLSALASAGNNLQSVARYGNKASQALGSMWR